jgi:hypothetical protein
MKITQRTHKKGIIIPFLQLLLFCGGLPPPNTGWYFLKILAICQKKCHNNSNLFMVFIRLNEGGKKWQKHRLLRSYGLMKKNALIVTPVLPIVRLNTV